MYKKYKKMIAKYIVPNEKLFLIPASTYNSPPKEDINIDNFIFYLQVYIIYICALFSTNDKVQAS